MGIGDGASETSLKPQHVRPQSCPSVDPRGRPVRVPGKLRPSKTVNQIPCAPNVRFPRSKERIPAFILESLYTFSGKRAHSTAFPNLVQTLYKGHTIIDPSFVPSQSPQTPGPQKHSPPTDSPPTVPTGAHHGPPRPTGEHPLGTQIDLGSKPFEVRSRHRLCLK